MGFVEQMAFVKCVEARKVCREYHSSICQQLCSADICACPQQTAVPACGVNASCTGEGGMAMRGSSMSLPQSLEQWPPTVTAAVWKALEDRSELAAKRSSVPSEEATRVSERECMRGLL